MDSSEIGAQVNFSSLFKAWSDGDSSTRAASRIEYRTATGILLAPGVTLCDESTVIQGNGKVDFRRRGDFGEREDFRPGSWSSHCDSTQIERLWHRLGEIDSHSFPARVADPGDTLEYLTGIVAGRVHTLTIGPTDPSKPSPGDAFMEELYPILSACDEGECRWAVETNVQGLRRLRDGAEAEIRFHNSGSRPIGLVFNGEPGKPDYHFRFAKDRKEIPYPEWHHGGNSPRDSNDFELILLEPGAENVRQVVFPCTFPDSGAYIGKVDYRQTRYLDSLAGIRILTGITYTEMAAFTV